ncbi:MAG TPA: hypothetical protein VIM42_12310 [Clostridium sp.]
MNDYESYFSNVDLQQYFKEQIGKIFKILPLHEDGCPTLKIYIQSLQIELQGGKSFIVHNQHFLQLLFCIEGLSLLKDMKLLKPTVFKCIGLCEKIIKDLEETKS